MSTAATATVAAPDNNTAASNSSSQAQAPHSPTNPNASTDQTISYSAERIIGNGSFGVVFQAAVVETGEIVAIKKVLQDKRFKNRELQIMRQLVKDPHSNIVALKHCFYSQVRFIYLNVVIEMHSTCMHHCETFLPCRISLTFIFLQIQFLTSRERNQMSSTLILSSSTFLKQSTPYPVSIRKQKFLCRSYTSNFTSTNCPEP